MTDKTRNTARSQKSTRTSKHTAPVVDWRLIASAYAKASAAVLRHSARELEDLAEAKHVAPDEMIVKLHRILAGDAASAFVGAQDLHDALSRAS